MSDRKTQRAVYRNNDRKKVVKKLYEEEIALLKDRVSVLNAELSKLQNISSSITWNGSYCTRCQKWWTKPAYLKTHKCWPGHEGMYTFQSL